MVSAAAPAPIPSPGTWFLSSFWGAWLPQPWFAGVSGRRFLSFGEQTEVSATSEKEAGRKHWPRVCLAWGGWQGTPSCGCSWRGCRWRGLWSPGLMLLNGV